MNTNFFKNYKVIITFVIVVGAIGLFGAKDKLSGLFGGSSKEATQQIVKEFIEQNPQVILDSVMRLQEQKMHEAQAKAQETVMANKTALENAADSPTLGKSDASFVVVQFFDYRCGHCKQSAKDLAAFVAASPEAKIVYRNLPLLGPDSVKAAQASLAVHKLYPALFAQFHSDMLANPNVNMQEIDKLFEKYSMNKENLTKEMQSTEIAKILDGNKELAGKIGLRGVPAYVINGQLAPGTVNADVLRSMLAQSKQPAGEVK